MREKMANAELSCISGPPEFEKGASCDMHVHSRGSKDVIPLRFTRLFSVRESYSSPEDIYATARKTGRRFVTITDHNSIEESLRLTYIYPVDTFTGCEYAVKATEEGQVVDVLCYDIDMETHNELVKMRKNVYLGEFVDYLRQKKIIHAGAHLAEAVKPKIRIKSVDLMIWIDMFGIIETLNGDAMRANDIAGMCIDFRNRHKKPGERKIAGIGGSDAHTLHTIGRAYTIAPNARTKGEFLEALAGGEVHPGGEGGSYEVTKADILEGVEAYKRYELGQMREKIGAEKEKWQNSKYLRGMPFLRFFTPQTIGFFRYADNNLKKVFGMAILPALKPILSKLIAANLKTKTEKDAYELEKRCIDNLIRAEYADAYKYYEYVEGIRNDYREHAKPEHHYMPKVSSRMLRWLQRKFGWADADYDKRDYD
ncbi:MAG: PHP-associated domain-containing protein [Nanoarchaeota archaeon]|nr:PHP-associated domain-containing protein [Nanoarchaeota archaeon]